MRPPRRHVTAAQPERRRRRPQVVGSMAHGAGFNKAAAITAFRRGQDRGQVGPTQSREPVPSPAGRKPGGGRGSLSPSGLRGRSPPNSASLHDGDCLIVRSSWSRLIARSESDSVCCVPKALRRRHRGFLINELIDWLLHCMQISFVLFVAFLFRGSESFYTNTIHISSNSPRTFSLRSRSGCHPILPSPQNLNRAVMNLSKNNGPPYSTSTRFRKLHNTLSPVVALPLLVSALSATIWTICRRWFGFSKESTKFLLQIHQGDGILQKFIRHLRL